MCCAGLTQFTNAIQSDGLEILSLHPSHIIKLRSFSLYHNDPYDRMLISQAQAECMILLTIDKMVKKYDVEIA